MEEPALIEVRQANVPRWSAPLYQFSRLKMCWTHSQSPDLSRPDYSRLLP